MSANNDEKKASLKDVIESLEESIKERRDLIDQYLEMACMNELSPSPCYDAQGCLAQALSYDEQVRRMQQVVNKHRTKLRAIEEKEKAIACRDECLRIWNEKWPEVNELAGKILTDEHPSNHDCPDCREYRAKSKELDDLYYEAEAIEQELGL